MTPSYEQLKFWFTNNGDPARYNSFCDRIKKRTDGCWVWLGRMSESGQPIYDYEDGIARVSRICWIWIHKADLPDNIVLRHGWLCNTRDCVNPAHLVGGDRTENNEDKDHGQQWDAMLKWCNPEWSGKPNADGTQYGIDYDEQGLYRELPVYSVHS